MVQNGRCSCKSRGKAYTGRLLPRIYSQWSNCLVVIMTVKKYIVWYSTVVAVIAPTIVHDAVWSTRQHTQLFLSS